MFAYVTPSYIPVSPPAFSYPRPRFMPIRAPTARERYLNALADAQSAQERYIAELEEQRFLSSLRQREALRQAEFRQRQTLAAQDFIARRRAGRACGGRREFAPCGPGHRYQVAPAQHRSHHLQADRLKAVEELFEAFLGGVPRDGDQEELHNARAPRADQPASSGFQNGHPTAEQVRENPIRSIEQLVEALLRGTERAQDEQSKEQKKSVAHAETGQKPVPHKAQVHFESKLKSMHEEAQAAYATQPAIAPAGRSHVHVQSTPTGIRIDTHFSPSVAPLSRRPEVTRGRNHRDRAAYTIQRLWRSHSADAAALKEALSVVAALQARFQFLHDSFNFPEHLEFREAPHGEENQVPPLAYTPPNAAVHGYTHELTKLLMRADAVLSGGSGRVREARRTFVRAVEEELAAVEARIAKIWGKRAEGTPATPNVGQPAESVDASSKVEGHAVAADVAKEKTSDVAPPDLAQVPTDAGLALPSVNAPVDASREPHSQDMSPIVPQDSTKPAADTEGNNVAVPTSEEDSPPRDEITSVQHSPESLVPEAEIIADRSLPEPMDASDFPATDGLDDSKSPRSRSSSQGSTDRQPEQPPRHSEDNDEVTFAPDSSNALETIIRVDVDVTTPLDANIPNSTSGADAFDVVYPDSPSSTSIALEPGVHPKVDADGDSAARGDENASETNIDGDRDRDRAQNRNTEEDGYELL